MKTDQKKKILQLVNTAGKMNHLRIYDVEFKASLVRVYIDNIERDVDLNLCEKLMKSLLFLFQSNNIEDVECEVSSPGVERSLKKDWHFLTAVGQTIKIRTSEPVFCYDKNQEKKRQATILSGQLCKCKDNVISVRDGLLDWTIPLDTVIKANIVFKEKQQGKRGVV
ncbi:MAG: hypothetical protein OXH36_03615 [Bdellovibrionales bacterium]|nr:hypothetical protein [Bdellovibrionales bacterium]